MSQAGGVLLVRAAETVGLTNEPAHSGPVEPEATRWPGHPQAHNHQLGAR